MQKANAFGVFLDVESDYIENVDSDPKNKELQQKSNNTMVLILDGNSLTNAHAKGNLCFLPVQGIQVVKEQSQIGSFYPKRPISHQANREGC